jgi:hypothetical protein
MDVVLVTVYVVDVIVVAAAAAVLEQVHLILYSNSSLTQ